MNHVRKDELQTLTAEVEKLWYLPVIAPPHKIFCKISHTFNVFDCRMKTLLRLVNYYYLLVFVI